MMDTIVQLITVCASGVILYRAEPALNRMDRHTHMMVRASMFLLVIGSTAQIGSVVLIGGVPSWPAAALFSGVAALLSCERRFRVLIPHQRREIRP